MQGPGRRSQIAVVAPTHTPPTSDELIETYRLSGRPEDFERIVTRWEKDHPEVELHRQITGRSARTVLLEATYDAQLLVLGRRGRGGLPHMMLGSVTQTLLSHTPCPVAVVGTR